MTAVEVGDGIAKESSSDDYDQVMFTHNVETVEAFSSCVMPVKSGKAYTRGCTNVMTQALQMEDGSLLQGLTIQNMYTELRQGSKKAVVVVKNSRAFPQALQKKTQVARAVMAIPVPKPPMEAQLQEEEQSPGSSYPQIDCQAKTQKTCRSLVFSGTVHWFEGRQAFIHYCGLHQV